MGTSDTLRSVIDAGRSSKRLDELSSARVIGKIALQVHSAQQKAGAGKAVGPITPSQIKLAPSGEAKLDLGEGSSLGYSSPEQINGSAGDRRSDVFSLGTVLWEALTYARLFDAMNDAAVKVAVQEREIMAPSELNANVPAELSAICMRALARNPSDRYQSLKAMAVEIEEFLEEAGYADDDTKIASYLGSLHAPPEQVKITMPPLTRPASSTPPPPTAPEKQASGTQPPPNVMKQPAAPSMLGEPPKQTERAKNPSGAALATALANAGAQPAPSNGATASAPGGTSTSGGLPSVKSAATIVGVAKADEWQDTKSTTHPPQNVAAPAVPPADASASAAVPGAPLTPMPPVLPQGSAPTLRSDKSTIAATVPPMVNATVEAKHVEAKAPALIVDEPKQPAMIVDDGKTTLVDDKPPAIEVPKLVNGRLPEPESKKPSQIETLPVSALAATPGIAPKPAETKPAEPKPAETKRAETKPSRAKSQSEAKRRAPSSADKSAPHPVGAVSLGPGPGRDSKDVLAGWGWGTDKHDVLPPEGYSDDLDYEPAPEHNARKTLLYVIGGGCALVALITIIALASGGSKNTKKPEAAAKVDTSRPAIDQPPTPQPPPPPPTPTPAPAPDQGSAAVAAGSAATGSAQPAPAPDETAKAAEAAKAEADRVAAEQETARQAEVAKQEAAKAEAEAKQAEAARLAQEKADAKKAADDAKKAEAARVAEEKNAKKAEAARLAAERAEAKKAEAAKRAETAKQAQAKRAEAAKAEAAKRTENAKRAPTRTEPKTNVAKAEPKADVEQLYRTGLQQYARGDTQAALASLRTALAANPSYAPTWRGLGLVFEKLGEKDQARAAFKRYLQLSPGAGDAEQIKSRLERLGS